MSAVDTNHAERHAETHGKPRILTGDTPTGSLHLGHWVGSVKRRVELQDSHDCYFIIANMHAYTTRLAKSDEIKRDSIGIVRDYLAMGIDPEKATIFLQSEIPAIAELTFLFAMLLPFNRVMRNPTLKTEIELKGLGETYSFGFPLYAVGQKKSSSLRMSATESQAWLSSSSPPSTLDSPSTECGGTRNCATCLSGTASLLLATSIDSPKKKPLGVNPAASCQGCNQAVSPYTETVTFTTTSVCKATLTVLLAPRSCMVEP